MDNIIILNWLAFQPTKTVIEVNQKKHAKLDRHIDTKTLSPICLNSAYTRNYKEILQVYNFTEISDKTNQSI
jgi:hypothetical protein